MSHSSANYLLSAGEMQVQNYIDKKKPSYPEGEDFRDPFHRPDPEIQGDKIIPPNHKICQNAWLRIQFESVIMC